MLLCSVLLAGCRAQKDFDAEPTWPTPLRGMVVCEQPLASAAGAAILERGGNAVDAAVAAALALCVVFPQAGNLGGGGFALWVPHSGEPRFLDFRERAPESSIADLYLDATGKFVPERALVGPLATAVPGSPAGLWRLHAELGSGKLTFWQLARPAIELASSGFRVDEELARALREEHPRKRLESSPAAHALFYPGGEPLSAGALLVQPDLARTLSYYAREGPPGFYRGPIARAIVSELRRLADVGGVPGELDDRVRGIVAPEDLHGYEAVWREPLRGWFRGTEVITAPPPSSGGVVLLQVLAVLDGFPIHTEVEATLTQRALLPPAEPVGPAAAAGLDDRIVHWWIEALRRAFAERAAVLGDPDFVQVPLRRLLSSAWVADARLAIGEEAARTAPTVRAAREGSETTHISVVDAAGNAVSLTTTLNSTFGSGTMVSGAGFLLNNEMDDFAIVPAAPNQFGLLGSQANAIEPRKRPLSSMTPTVLRDGGHTVVMVLGSPGGPRIITAVIGVVLRTMVLGESLAEAVAAPRFHQQWSPPETVFEPGWPAEILDGLRRRGHAVKESESTWGSVQAIRVLPNRELRGVSDPRSSGAALAAPGGRERGR
jgi:gamma-glutamyltranspeptidase/glutathione hydrolase